LGNLSRWTLLLLSRRHLLLRRTHLLTLLGLLLWSRLRLTEAYLYLPLDLDLALQLDLTLRLCLTLHLRRSCLNMGQMRTLLLLLLLLLLHRRSLLTLHLSLLDRRWLLPLRLSGTGSCSVEYPAPNLGTGNTAYTKGLGNDCTADSKAYLLNRILLEEVGRFVEPAVLTAYWCLSGGGRCLDGLLLLLLNDLGIRLYRQGRRDIDLLLVLIDDLTVLLRVDGGLRCSRGLMSDWRSLLGLCMILSLLLLHCIGLGLLRLVRLRRMSNAGLLPIVRLTLHTLRLKLRWPHLVLEHALVRNLDLLRWFTRPSSLHGR
jgi:hypothetical protein